MDSIDSIYMVDGDCRLSCSLDINDSPDFALTHFAERAPRSAAPLLE